jgi:hypothetical protein
LKVKAQLAWFIEEFKSWLFSCSFRKVWHKFNWKYARSLFFIWTTAEFRGRTYSDFITLTIILPRPVKPVFSLFRCSAVPRQPF